MTGAQTSGHCKVSHHLNSRLYYTRIPERDAPRCPAFCATPVGIRAATRRSVESSCATERPAAGSLRVDPTYPKPQMRYTDVLSMPERMRLKVRPIGRRDSILLFFSSRRRHTRFDCDWSSDVCSSDLRAKPGPGDRGQLEGHILSGLDRPTGPGRDLYLAVPDRDGGPDDRSDGLSARA